ncbi:MAG: helix-turn-helix domain-containing protein [Mycobacteriales bacterium]
MTRSQGPTVRRKQLGAELRRLRQDARISMEEAAAALDCARSKVSHIETGRYGPRKPDLEVLLRLYGALDKLDTLEELRREGTKRGWWSTYKLPEYLADLVGLEADAVIESALELELIPALLQTEEYARTVHVAGPHMTPSSEVDRRVAARMQRQKRLVDADPLALSVVISEAALRRTAAQPSIAVEQLRRLASDAQLSNVTVQVLPFSAGVHASMSGSFTLLDFAPGVLSRCVYQEYAAGGHLVDDPGVVQLLNDLYDALRRQALDADESLALIAEVTQQAESEEPHA